MRANATIVNWWAGMDFHHIPHGDNRYFPGLLLCDSEPSPPALKILVDWKGIEPFYARLSFQYDPNKIAVPNFVIPISCKRSAIIIPCSVLLKNYMSIFKRKRIHNIPPNTHIILPNLSSTPAPSPPRQ